MTKHILIALAFAALPALAQEAPAPCDKPCAPKCHRPHGPRGDMHKHMLEKFDANKDGQLDEQEKAAMKAAREARHAEMKQKMLEKFDANKDGQLDEQEKAAMKAEFEAKRGEKPCGDKPCCGPKGPRGPKPGCGPEGHGPKGPRHHKGHGPRPDMHKHMMEKFDANKDGQLDEQEKAAMKADFEAKKAERKAKFMEKFDVNKNGQIDEEEKAAIKADFEANGPKGPKGPHGCPCKG